MTVPCRFSSVDEAFRRHFTVTHLTCRFRDGNSASACLHILTWWRLWHADNSSTQTNIKTKQTGFVFSLIKISILHYTDRRLSWEIFKMCFLRLFFFGGETGEDYIVLGLDVGDSPCKSSRSAALCPKAWNPGVNSSLRFDQRPNSCGLICNIEKKSNKNIIRANVEVQIMPCHHKLLHLDRNCCFVVACSYYL